MTHDARERARRSWACSDGPHPTPAATVVDVWLQDNTPRDKPLNFVMFGGIPVVHRELLKLFGDDNVERDLYIGRVIGARGKELPDWVTARGRDRLIVRGTRNAGSRICDVCGRLFYFAQGANYLYPAPPNGRAIYESSSCGFVVTREIGERIADHKWRRMTVEPIPVIDPPPDGLGILPPC